MKAIVNGYKIQKLRLEKGWTLEDLARLVGCEISTISRIERGLTKRPLPHVVQGLIAQFGQGILMRSPNP